MSDRTPTKAIYETPNVLLIGNATEVILGVAGGGEDYLGYSVPEFEFAEDPVAGDELHSEP
ncbi:MAG: hypothetical protein K2Y23_03620 [Cyanobacteria bacterium]|nr:hypothetical protein [Cyanobacteriota bacterium]